MARYLSPVSPNWTEDEAYARREERRTAAPPRSSARPVTQPIHCECVLSGTPHERCPGCPAGEDTFERLARAEQ